jgi:hypothetical protein
VEEELPHACERRTLLAADLRHIKAEVCANACWLVRYVVV